VKILNAIREKGIRYCIAIAFDRFVPQWLLRVRRFNVYEMETGIDVATESGDVAVSWSDSEEETLAVEQFMGPMRSVVDVGADDMRACYAKVGGEMAAAFWMASNIFMESGLTRRQGIYTQILEFMLPDLQASGKSQVLLSVNPDNVASRVVHEKYARRKVGSAIAVRVLGIAACTVSGDMTVNRRFTLSHKKKPIVIRFGREVEAHVET